MCFYKSSQKEYYSDRINDYCKSLPPFLFENIEIPEEVELSTHLHKLRKTNTIVDCSRSECCISGANTINEMWECKECNYTLC